MIWKKFSPVLSVFSAFQFFALCDGQELLSQKNPSPPRLESKTGYLTASQDFEIPPEFPKIFIAPQITLPIVENLDDSYVFLVKVDSFVACCKIPKYQKFIVLMELSKDKKSIYFRGGIEADTVPLKIFKNEEMPITGDASGNYIVSLVRGKINVSVKIPKNAEGLVFNRQSSFAKFAEEQKKKGVEYYNGQWMPSEKVQSLRNSQLASEMKKKEGWNSLKSQAESGVIVLKNGRILHGSYKGGGGNTVFFESEDGKTDQYGVEDVADYDCEEAVALGNLDSASQCILKSKEFEESYPGDAKRGLEQAQAFLRKINPSLAEMMEKSMDLGAQIAKMNEQIDVNLKNKGLLLYNYEVFPAEVLNYTLNG